MGRSSGAPVAGPTPCAGGRWDLPQLTGLRIVAAVWVLLHHLSYLPVGGDPGWLAPVAPLLAAGPLGVDLFFALSGFLLARAYVECWRGAPDRRQAVLFLWARLARVWPLYAVVVVLFGAWCALRACLGSDGIITWQALQPGLGLESWLRQLSMTQMWGSGGLDGVSFVLPTWTVSAEWLAYLALPVMALGAWRMRTWPRPMLAVLAVLAAAPVAVVAVLEAYEGFWFVRIAAGFSAGVLTWLVVRRVPATPRVAHLARRVVVGLLTGALVIVYWAATAAPGDALSAEDRLYLVVPAVPVLLGALALSDRDRGPARWLATPALQAGGRRSYALYLVHYPLVEMALVAMTRLPALAPHTTGALLVVPCVLAASALLAAAAYRWVEVPARSRMLRMDPSRRVGSARRDVREARRVGGIRRAVGRRVGSHAARPTSRVAPA